MRYSLGAHVRQTTPDILYGDAGQLWVDRGDDLLVWLFELWTSKSPREGFGGHLVLWLLEAGSEVVGLSRCDLEHFL